MKRLFTAVSVIALASTALAVGAAPAGAAPKLPPEVRTDCDGDIPIVVGSDDAAQPDIYAAVTLAGVIGTDCIVLAGPRDRPMPSGHKTRLDAAEPGGWIVGGTAAVPAFKTAGRDMTRLAGVDRWHTARLVGAVAADPYGDIEELTRRTAPTSTTGTDTADPEPEVSASYACQPAEGEWYYVAPDGSHRNVTYGTRGNDRHDHPWGSNTGWDRTGVEDVRCEFVIRNRTGEKIRVAISAWMIDLAGDRMSTNWNSPNHGLWFGIDLQRTVKLSAGNNSDAQVHLAAWRTNGRLMATWCRFWRDEDLNRYPGIENSEPCELIGNGRAN